MFRMVFVSLPSIPTRSLRLEHSDPPIGNSRHILTQLINRARRPGSVTNKWHQPSFSNCLLGSWRCNVGIDSILAVYFYSSGGLDGTTGTTKIWGCTYPDPSTNSNYCCLLRAVLSVVNIFISSILMSMTAAACFRGVSLTLVIASGVRFGLARFTLTTLRST